MTIYRNTIIHGDCLTTLPQLPAESINFILTDPPYTTRYKSRDGRTVPNDDNAAWLKPAFAEMFRVLAQDSFCVSFYGRDAPPFIAVLFQSDSLNRIQQVHVRIVTASRGLLEAIKAGAAYMRQLHHSPHRQSLSAFTSSCIFR